MKIGIDARMFSDAFTGIGRYNYELTKFLFTNSPPGINWVLFMNDPEYSQFEFPYANVRKIRVNAPHYSFSEQVSFLRILLRENCDLLHFTHFNLPLGYNRKFIVTIHDTTLSFYPGKKMASTWRRLAYNAVIKHAVKSAAKIIAVSENTKKDIIKLFNIPPAKIVKIYNGLGNEFQEVPEEQKKSIRKKYGLPEHFLLYTGGWRENKNLVRLLKAFRIILDKSNNLKEPTQVENLQLVMTGNINPNYPEVLNAIKELNLQNHTKRVGIVPIEDLIALYNAATIFVFPSLYEGFGFPPLEAMKTGTPVAASNVSSIPEICDDAVQYFDPLNVDDIAQKIIQMLTDKTLQVQLGKKGIDRCNLFSWEKCGSETLKIYENALNF